MKRILSLIAVFAAGGAINGALSQQPLNSSDARGYLERGAVMYVDRNYNGCMDQIGHIQALSPNVTADAETALYYLAKATLHCGDDEALDLLRMYLDLYPESVRFYEITKCTGDFHFTRSNYPEALKAYSTIPAEALDGAQREDLSYRTAYSMMMLGEETEADSIFTTLTGSRKYGNAAKFYKGYIAYCSRDYNQALEWFGRTDTSVAPGDAVPCYAAQIYFSRHDYDRSLTSAREAIERGCPDEFRAEMHRIAGESLYALGDSRSAREYLESYLSLLPESDIPDRSAMYILGVCLYGDGEYSRAIPMFRKSAGASDAMGQSAYLYLGQCYVKEDNTDGALMAFENAYRLNYDRKVAETAFYNYIVARHNGGRVPFGNSVAMLEEFLRKYPDSNYADAVRESLVSGYLSDNDYTAALRVLDNMRHPSGSALVARQKVLFVLGTRAAQSGDNESATGYLTRAIESRGGIDLLRRQSTLWRGISRYNTGNYPEAEADLADFEHRGDGDAGNMTRCRYYLGYSRFAQEDYDKAFGDFRRVADNAATDAAMRADAYNRMGDCRYYSRNYSSAGDYYAKALESNPSGGDYPSYRMATMKGLGGNSRDKIAALQRLTSKYPNSPLVPAAMLDIAQTQAAINRADDALATYVRLTDAYPGTSQARKGMLQMALLQYETGREAEGEQTYRRVISTYPTSEEAGVAVDDLKRLYASEGKLRDLADYLESVPGAPRIEVSEIDAATFRAAERDYLDNHNTARLTAYLHDYPDGAYASRALYYMAEYSDEEGNAEDAHRYASRLVTAYPDAEVTEDALLIKAATEEALGMHTLAFESYTALESRASTPQNVQSAREGIVNTAIRTERYDRAIEAADRLLSSNIQGPDRVRMKRALALDRTGHGEEARAEWQRLLESQETAVSAESTVLLGQSLLNADEPDKAIATVNTLIDAGTPHNYWLARAYIVLSDALRASGNTFDADEYLRLLRANYPGKEADIQEMITSRLSE